MPRDSRLFMTFPIEFPEHPKVKPLSVLAKWVFVEMNAYSRRYDLDGVIPVVTAHSNWSRKALAELVSSHPDRPLVLLEGDVYVIRDYAEHQETTESIQKRRETNAQNGRKGGRRATAKRPETESLTESVSKTEPNEKQSPESRVQSPEETDVTYLLQGSSEIPASDGLTEEEMSSELAKVGIRNIGRISRAVSPIVGDIPHVSLLIDVTRSIILGALEPVQNVESYVEAACSNSPEKVAKAWRLVMDDWENAAAAIKAVAS